MRWMLLCCTLWAVGCGGAIDPSSEGGNCNHHVYRHDPSGWLIPSVEMHLVYWGSYWRNDNNGAHSLIGIWFDLFSDEVLARLSQYGIKGGELDPNAYLNNPNVSITSPDGGTTSLPTDGGMEVLDDNGIATEINNEIQAGLLPPPNDSTLYMILLPPNVRTNYLIAHNFGGYHNSATSYAGDRYTFAIISYQPETVGDDILISHELYEAATNPNGWGWFDDQTTNEIGDFCEGLTVPVGDFAVQKVWQENVCECL